MFPIDYAAFDQNTVTNIGNGQFSIQFPPDQALIDSSNYLGKLTIGKVGQTGLRNTAQSLGLTTPGTIDTGDTMLNFANGQVNASLLQMTDAYQALANQGQRVPPTGILDIYDRNGKQIYHYNTAQVPTTQAVPAAVANHITR
jgi:membrane peptidoglycan carboxypeptidase